MWKKFLIKNNKLFQISVLVNALLIAAVFALVLRYGVLGKIRERVTHEEAKKRMAVIVARQKKDLSYYFKEMHGKSIGVVFLGDSIMRGAGVYFSGYFAGNNILYAGVDGDNSEGVLGRLDEVIQVAPKKVFFMVGINDLRAGMSVDEIFLIQQKIVMKLKQNGIVPVVHGVICVGRDDAAKDVNHEVITLNRKLAQWTQVENVNFIDLNDVLSAEGYLRSNMTHDGLHLSAEGYKVWADRLKKEFN